MSSTMWLPQAVILAAALLLTTNAALSFVTERRRALSWIRLQTALLTWIVFGITLQIGALP